MEEKTVYYDFLVEKNLDQLKELEKVLTKQIEEAFIYSSVTMLENYKAKLTAVQKMIAKKSLKQQCHSDLVSNIIKILEEHTRKFNDNDTRDTTSKCNGVLEYYKNKSNKSN